MGFGFDGQFGLRVGVLGTKGLRVVPACQANGRIVEPSTLNPWSLTFVCPGACASGQLEEEGEVVTQAQSPMARSTHPALLPPLGLSSREREHGDGPGRVGQSNV